MENIKNLAESGSIKKQEYMSTARELHRMVEVGELDYKTYIEKIKERINQLESEEEVLKSEEKNTEIFWLKRIIEDDEMDPELAKWLKS